jgi:hypothetical protein
VKHAKRRPCDDDEADAVCLVVVGVVGFAATSTHGANERSEREKRNAERRPRRVDDLLPGGATGVLADAHR